MSTSGWQIFVEVPGRAPIELEPGEAVIGRSRSCAVQVAESTVSRQHAVFVVEPGTVRLKDLGSSNGTYVNGKRVDGSIGLGDGDRVVVGEAELVIRILAPLGPAEATQKLNLPPLTAPAPESLRSPAATQPAAEAPFSFRRTPTEVPGASAVPAAVVPAVPPPPVASPSPKSPPPPPPPPIPAPPVVASAVERAGLAPKGSGELLSSIREIDSAPVPTSPSRKVSTGDRLTPAGFWIRVAAYLLDMLPIVVVMLIGVVLAFTLGPDAGILVSVVQGVLVFAYGILLAVVMPALKGTTPGKKLLKLAIVSEQTVPGQGLGWSTALLRLVGHFVCGMTFYLGYVLVAFTAQKQGLHDLIAKTRVVRRS